MTYGEVWIMFLKIVAVIGAILGIIAIIALGADVNAWFFLALIPAIPTAIWIVNIIIESD